MSGASDGSGSTSKTARNLISLVFIPFRLFSIQSITVLCPPGSIGRDRERTTRWTFKEFTVGKQSRASLD